MKLYWRIKIDGKWTYKAATEAKEIYQYLRNEGLWREMNEL